MDPVSVDVPVSVVTSRLEPATVRLAFVGEVDLATAAQVRSAVMSLLDGPDAPRRVRVDLGKVTFLDAVGVGILVDAWRAAAVAGIRFEVLNPRGMVGRVLSIPGIADDLPVVPAQPRREVRGHSGGDGISEPWSHRTALF
jgi:anti-anti-sigma factor